MRFGKILFLLGALVFGPAFASTSSCPESLRPEPDSKSDAYSTFLRFHPTQTSTLSLFQKAATDQELRDQLNQQIRANGLLRSSAEKGIAFRGWATTFTRDSLAFHQTSSGALYPWQTLDSEYQKFLKSLEVKKENPMRAMDAERNARSDLLFRYGISEESISPLFISDPGARTYFQQRVNYYLNQEVQNAALRPAKKEERFRYWFKRTLSTLESERAENLRALVVEAPDLVKKVALFQIRTPRTAPTKPGSEITFSELAHSRVRIGGPSDGEGSFELKYNRLIDPDRNRFFQLFSFSTWLETPYSRGSSLPKSETATDSTSKTALIFTVNPGDLDPGPVQEFSVSLGDIEKLASDLMKKTSGAGKLEASTLAQARWEYELQLREKIAKLQEIRVKTNIIHFGSWSSSQASGERRFFETSSVTPGVLPRFSTLSEQKCDDLLCGLQWFGYSIHPDYWRNRDQLQERSTSLPLGIPLRDWWDKSKSLTRDATIVSLVLLGGFSVMGLTEQSGLSHPGPSSNSIMIGETDQVRDHSARDQNKKLFEVEVDLDPSSLSPYFDHGSVADIEVESDLIDVTESMQITNSWSFPERNEKMIRIRSELDQIPIEGYLFLPRPEGYEPISVSKWYPGDSIRILKNTATGMYMVKVITSAFGSFGMNVGFVKSKAVEPSPELSARLENIDRGRLQSAIEKVRHAGLLGLSSDLELLLQKPEPISAKDLSDAIRRGQRYSLIPGRGHLWALSLSRNPFLKYRRYLRQDGLLYFKCDAANDLFQTLVREVLPEDSDLVALPLHSHVYQPERINSVLERQEGSIGSIGHARTQFILKGRPGKIILDATPDTPETSGVAPWASSLASNPETPPSPLGPAGTLPDPIRVPREPQVEESAPQEKKWRTELIQRLEPLIRQILPLPGFKALVKNNRHEYLPPQRAYILARKALAYAKDKEAKIDSFFAEISTSLGVDPVPQGAGSTNVRALLSVIIASEKSLWEKCSKYHEKTRKRTFEWTQDHDLRRRTDELLEALTTLE